MKKLITPISITAADSNSRTISGRIVTFEETGTASIGKVQFAKGSIDPQSVLLNLEHDRTRRIGKQFQSNRMTKESTRHLRSPARQRETMHSLKRPKVCAMASVWKFISMNTKLSKMEHYAS
jgi:hypothetical protein